MRLVYAFLTLTALASTSVWAQNSVSVFGVVDLNVRSVKNGSAGSTVSLSQDGVGSSRLGLRGTEDIGGGNKVQFWLEGFLLPDTGAAPQAWTRRSTLGLITRGGELRFGRDYVPDFWNHTIFDPFGTNGVGSGINMISAMNGAGTFLRANNTVGYLLPPMGGMYGQIQVAAGEGSIGNKHVGFRAGYESGPFNVAVAAGKTTVDDTREWSRWNIGASYSFGIATVTGLFSDTEASGGGNNGEIIRFALLGVQVPMERSSLKFSYSRTDGRGVPIRASRDASQIAFGYQYDFSLRTAVYANASRISNKGNANYVASASGPSGMRGGETSTGFELGVRHEF